MNKIFLLIGILYYVSDLRGQNIPIEKINILIEYRIDKFVELVNHEKNSMIINYVGFDSVEISFLRNGKHSSTCKVVFSNANWIPVDTNLKDTVNVLFIRKYDMDKEDGSFVVNFQHKEYIFVDKNIFNYNEYVKTGFCFPEIIVIDSE